MTIETIYGLVASMQITTMILILGTVIVGVMAAGSALMTVARIVIGRDNDD